MDESTFDVGDFNDLLSTVSSQAAPWVSAFTGTQVVPTALNSSQAAYTQLQIQQQAQARLAAQNPTVAGVLSSPTVILLLVGGLIILLLFLFLR